MYLAAGSNLPLSYAGTVSMIMKIPRDRGHENLASLGSRASERNEGLADPQREGYVVRIYLL